MPMSSIVKHCFILLFMVLFPVACSSKAQTDFKGQRIRLAQVWQSQYLFSTAAINRRGPIVVWLAHSKNFKALGLEEQTWLQPRIASDLKLNTRMNLTGHRQTELLDIELDGLKDTLKFKVTLPNAEEEKAMPKHVDLIIPIGSLITLTKLQVFALKQEGFLELNSMPKLEHQYRKTGGKTSQKLKNTPIVLPESKQGLEQIPQYLQRFNDLFSINEAFPNSKVAERIDLKDRVEFRWFPPLLKLPQDLWLATSLDLKTDDEPMEKVIVHLRKPKAITLKASNRFNKYSYFKKTYKRGELTPKKDCTISSPCPVYIQDLYRLNRKCLHDLCIIKTKQLNHSMQPLTHVDQKD